MTARTRPLGERLRAMREAAGLTQEALDKATGIGAATISRIENQYYDWLPAPDTVRSWTTATGHRERTDELLAMLADDKAAAARRAVMRRGKQGWCSQHRHPRAECRPEQTHPYSFRARGDLMAEVERQAAGGDVSGFITRALMAATGWEPPRGAPLLSQGHRPATAREAPPEAPGGREGGNGTSPDPAPVVPVAEAERAAEAIPAAKGNGPRRSGTATKKRPAVKPPALAAANGQEAVITELRERVPDLVTASELAAPVFRAGPDVDCAHGNMRIRKGVCPDCKQWVTK